MHFGIDYGSKLAGTTVITYDNEGILYQISSLKKQDADQMILDAVKELNPESIFMDAPLSLPRAYFGKGEDYFYREADKTLKAMSPMFLGGLTARAMRLKSLITPSGIEVIETYPGALIRSKPEWKEIYNKKDKGTIAPLLDKLMVGITPFNLHKTPETYHQVDSLIAWYSGLRHNKGIATRLGNPEEGEIIF